MALSDWLKRLPIKKIGYTWVVAWDDWLEKLWTRLKGKNGK